MKAVFSDRVSIMKRVLFSSLLAVAMAPAAFGYINNFQVIVPPMSPSLIQLDGNTTFPANSFVNQAGALFSVSQDFTPWKASNFLNYTNRGTMVGIPGFYFE